MDLSLNIKYKWLWNILKYIQLHLELQIKIIPFPIYQISKNQKVW